MCGIAGILAPGWDAQAVEARLRPMLKAIAHRGPDHEGVHVAHGAGIGMRRLSIIDLAGGNQPMFSADGRHCMVFNGEIYNYRELRKTLEQAGQTFATDSDSEVLLRGYCHWGEAVVDRLNGMFAFAMLDTDSGRLLLARDHFGIKPLYLARTDHFFAFCSEPAPLLTLPGISRRLDRTALSEFLAFKYVPSPRTLLQGIEKMPAAHILEAHPGDLTGRSRRFWTLARTAEADPSELGVRLQQAVQRQLVSDVPVGVFLSGGIDSGLLAWAAASSPQTLFDGAYTAGFKDRSYDETALAALTAKHLGIRHVQAELESPKATRLDAWVKQFQEPFANLSVPANFLISEWAARNVRVVLNGSGADELFGGYDRYYAVQPPLSLRTLHGLAPMLRPLLDTLPVGSGKRSLVHRGRRYLSGCRLGPCARHANSVRLFMDDEISNLAPGLALADNFVQQVCEDAPRLDNLHRAIWTDVNTMLPDDYLILVDRTSMAASIEVRVPFLDLDFAAYAFALHGRNKIRAWEKKVALRSLARQHLPLQIARQPKMGFESPVGAWFRQGLGQELLHRLHRSALAPLFDAAVVTRLVQEHEARQSDASKQLLGLFTLFSWAEQYAITL